MNDVGSRIKRYMKERGIKQIFLADKVGLTNPQVSDILNKGRAISCVEYYHICKALDVPLEKFFEEESHE